MNCVGTIELLLVSKDRGVISELRLVFLDLLNHRRFYSISLLNQILLERNERPITLEI
jgi:predicted nucleic acid-binding protein